MRERFLELCRMKPGGRHWPEAVQKALVVVALHHQDHRCIPDELMEIALRILLQEAGCCVLPPEKVSKAN